MKDVGFSLAYFLLRTALFVGCALISIFLSLSCGTVSASHKGEGDESGLPIDIVVQSGHSSGITTLALSPDSRLAASGGYDGSVILWDVESGRQLRSFTGHTTGLKSLLFSPTGEQLLSGDRDGNVHLWDVATGTIIQTLRCALPAYSLAFMPNGSFDFLQAFGDSVSKDLARNRTPTLRQFEFDNFYLSHDGQYALVFDLRRGGFLWDNSTDSHVKLPGKSNITAAAFSSENRLLVYATKDDIVVHDIQKNIFSTFSICNDIRKESEVSSIFLPPGDTSILTCESRVRFQQATFESWLTVRERNTGKIVHTVAFNRSFPSSCTFSSNGTLALIGGLDNSITVIDMENGREIRTFGKQTYFVPAASFGDNNRYLATSGFGSIAVWDRATGRNKLVIPVDQSSLVDKKQPRLLSMAGASEIFSPHGTYLFVRNRNFDPTVFEIESGKEYTTFPSLTRDVGFIRFTNDEQYLLGISSDSLLKAWEVRTGRWYQAVGKRFPATGSPVHYRDNVTDLFKLLSEGGIDLWDSAAHEKITLVPKKDILPLCTSDTTLLVELQSNAFVLHDPSTGDVIRTIDSSRRIGGSTSWPLCTVVSPNNKYLIVGSSSPDIHMWDIARGTLCQILRGHSGKIFTMGCSSDSKYLASASGDGTTKLWELETGRLVASFVVGGKDEYAIVLPSNYYAATKHASNVVQFTRGTQYFTFENVDLRYNRPDLVTSRLGMPDSSIVSAFAAAYQKRLRNAGLESVDSSGTFHLPTVTIDKHNLPFSTLKKTIDLPVLCIDQQVPLKRLDISVNNVPLFGNVGFPIGGGSSDRFEKTVKIPLSQGKNSIKVSATNEKGTRSYYQTLDIVRTDSVAHAPHVYLVSIGVSEFSDRQYNLSYASKDATDLGRLFGADNAFSGVTPIVLTDVAATKENIRACRESLRKSSVDDVVIIFVATHGLFDDALNYYLATTDVDFTYPSDRGLSYDELEQLFDDVAARKRLLLIDACHSGQVDKEEVLLAASTLEKQSGVTSRGFKTVVSKHRASFALKSSFELMQELFSDLENGNGIVAISSASGREFAYESSEWKNGVFTYALLEGLRTKSADLNRDGRVSVSELKEYVTRRVQQLTNGKQTPTSRRENLENDFIIDSYEPAANQISKHR